MIDVKDKKSVCVSGLGFIGLPTACVLATSGYSVLGVDINPEVVNHIQSLKFTLSEPNLQLLLENAMTSGNLKISTKVEAADIHIIAVPTPLTSDHKPNLSYLNTAIDALIPHLRTRDLVLIESTLSIGTTESIAQKLHKYNPEIYMAYCPERILPGNIIHELTHNDRVIGGINEDSALKAVNFYKSFVHGDIITTNARTAEAVKLAENTYRDINIAYANELSMIADHLNVNITELIHIANKHPRVHIHNPGPGVGGHCIPLSPWFLASSTPPLTQLITKAREINNNKTKWVIEKIRKTIRENNVRVVACLGLTYKPNVPDFRESSALMIVHALEKETRVLRVDPYLPNSMPLQEAIAKADLLIGLVAHREFQDIASHKITEKIVLDFAGVFE